MSAALAPEHKVFPPIPPLTPSLFKLPGGSARDHVPAKAIFSIQPSPIGIQFAGSTRSRAAAGFRLRRSRGGSGLQYADVAERVEFRHQRFLFPLFHYRTIVHCEKNTFIGSIMRRVLLSTFLLSSCHHPRRRLRRAAARNAT